MNDRAILKTKFFERITHFSGAEKEISNVHLFCKDSKLATGKENCINFSFSPHNPC